MNRQGLPEWREGEAALPATSLRRLEGDRGRVGGALLEKRAFWKEHFSNLLSGLSAHDSGLTCAQQAAFLTGKPGEGSHHILVTSSCGRNVTRYPTGNKTFKNTFKKSTDFP